MDCKTSNSSRLQQLLVALIGAFIGVLLITGVGWAHAFLESATPAEGSRLQNAPTELRLSFTEPIEVAFSSVTVTGPSGQNVAEAIAQTGITSSITVPLSGELEPGDYTVEWRVLSIDTHTTNGQFQFTVLGDPSTAPQQESRASNESGTATPEADAEDEDEDGDDAGGFGWGWPIAIGVVVGGLIVFLRGRR